MTDRTVRVAIKGDISDFNRQMLRAAAGTKVLAKSLDDTNSQMGVFVGSALTLGPALLPIAATATPAITGLASQLGFAALGAGVAAAAFNGIGDALKAVNKNAIEPSAANFEKMQRALAELGPSGASFVLFLQDVRPKMQELQELARDGLLPGVQQGMASILTQLPQIERIVSTVASSLGDLAAQGGEALAGPRWEAFFNYLETDAAPILTAFGQTLGNFTLSLANLFVAFAPASTGFSNSFLEMSRSFANWTANLPNTEGFQSFLDYIAEMGPKVWDMLSSIGDAIVALAEAAAPVGSILVPLLGHLADAFATILRSDAGPVLLGVVAAVNALSLALRAGNLANLGVVGKGLMAMTAGSRGSITALRGGTKNAATTQAEYTAAQKGALKAAGAVGILAFAASDLDEKLGLSNASLGASIGLMGGPWGVAIGASIGALKDLSARTDGTAQAIEKFNEAFSSASTLNGQKAALDSLQARIDLMRDSGIGFLGDDVEKLQAVYDDKNGVYQDGVAAAEAATFAEAGLTEAMAGASDETRKETLAMLHNIATKNAVADATLNAFNAETNYRQALKDAQEQAKNNNAGIEGNSEAALKNRDTLSALASAWNTVAAAGGKTEEDMKSAQAAFIQTAIDMGVGSEAAKVLANDLFNIPSPKPKVTLTGQEQAKKVAKQIQDFINAVRGKTVYITTIRRQGSAPNDNRARDRGQNMNADGGYISGPGGPRDDVIPAWLSNGEYVINAAATKANRGLLDSINNGGRAERFASGGPVGMNAGGAPSLVASMDERALARALEEVFDNRSFELSQDNRSLKFKVRNG